MTTRTPSQDRIRAPLAVGRDGAEVSVTAPRVTRAVSVLSRHGRSPGQPTDNVVPFSDAWLLAINHAIEHQETRERWRLD